MRELAILRPEPGASLTAQAARALGLQPILMPLFKIEAIVWTAPDPSSFDALLITSANAIRCGGPELRKLVALPVYAVGEATAGTTRGAGFKVASVGRGGIDVLLASIPPDLRLLHLCGADRRKPSSFTPSLTTLSVYRSAELPLPVNFTAIEGAVVAVHSPRAGERLAKLTDSSQLARDRTQIAALSAEAAQATGEGWLRVEAADEPNERALLALAARLCQNTER